MSVLEIPKPTSALECSRCHTILLRSSPDGLCGFCQHDTGSQHAPEPRMGEPPVKPP